MKDLLKLGATGMAIALAVATVGLLFFRMFWVTNVERHEGVFAFDRFSGQVETITNTGWCVRTPIRYSVYTIDLRPVQVTISANQRILNAKLVRFDIKGLDTFIAWHGMGAASGINASSLPEILKCYAFDSVNGADCPFLEVIQDIKPNQGELEKKQ